MTENDFRSRIFESDLSANARFVCLVLLHYRNRKTGLCFPSQDTIASACGLCRVTVVRAIKELEAAGYISIKKMRLKGTKYTSNVYEIDVECITDIQSNDQSVDLSLDVTNDLTNDVVQNKHKPIKHIKPLKGLCTHTTDAEKKQEKKSKTIDDFFESTHLPIPDLWAREAYDAGLSSEEVEWQWSRFTSYWLAKDEREAKKRDWQSAWRLWFMDALKNPLSHENHDRRAYRTRVNRHEKSK